jgi:hypothetical protein
MNLDESLTAALKAVEDFGPRSSKKLIPIHGFIAYELEKIFQKDNYNIHYNVGNSKINSEDTVVGLLYPKDIDITIIRKIDRKIILCIGLKFVLNNFKQNANNYIETMMGETANIQLKGIPYGHISFLQNTYEYFKKDGTKRENDEILNDKDIIKYINLMSLPKEQVVKPFAMAIHFLMNDFGIARSFLNESQFSENIIQHLKTDLSLQNFFIEANKLVC